jgi:hypothetical protein
MSIPKDNSPTIAKEGVNLAFNKPNDTDNPHATPVVTNDASISSTMDGKYFNDYINMRDLWSYIDKRMEDEKVIDIQSADVPEAVDDGSAMKDKVNESSTIDVSLHDPPVSVLKEKEVGKLISSSAPSTSTNKRANPFSKVGEIVDSDSEEEVLNTFDESANLFDMPMSTLSSTGGGHDQEEYYEYNDFTDQLYDLPGQLGAFYEDFKLQGRLRK